MPLASGGPVPAHDGMLELQRRVGNRAVAAEIQRQPRARSGQAPSAATRIRAAQSRFRRLMAESSAAQMDLRSYCHSLNGLYRSNFEIYRVVLAQAGAHEKRNEEIRLFLFSEISGSVGGALGKAGGILASAWKFAEKAKKVVEKVSKVKSIVRPQDDDSGAQSKTGKTPVNPSDLELVPLRSLLTFSERINSFRDYGDSIFEAASEIVFGDSSGASRKDVVAQSCEELTFETQVFLEVNRPGFSGGWVLPGRVRCGGWGVDGSTWFRIRWVGRSRWRNGAWCC